MPGLLPTSWANFFTRATNYEVDFTNFGRTITTQGVRQYSLKQVLDRAYIWGGMVVGGVDGYLVNNARKSDSSSYAPMAFLIACGVVSGFSLTHYHVAKQRIAFRKKMHADIERLETKIKQVIKGMPIELRC